MNKILSIEELLNTLPETVSLHEKQVTNKKGMKGADIPNLSESHVIVIPLIREVVAPIYIRNNDPDDITDIFYNGALRFRAIPGKFKSVEKRRGSQILRAIKRRTKKDVGGDYAANRVLIDKNGKAGDVLDINSFIFGESANMGSNPLPIHAAALYSDAISTCEKDEDGRIITNTCQGGVAEDGGTFDTTIQGTSKNLFNEVVVAPGTLFVQTIVIPGKRLSRMGLKHLLASISVAGSYGGRTAVTGTNIRTHFVGAFIGAFEKPVNAPLQMIESAKLNGSMSVEETKNALIGVFVEQYPEMVDSQTLSFFVDNLIEQIESVSPKLIEEYVKDREALRTFFNQWFTPDKKTKKGEDKNVEASGDEEPENGEE